ncbi:hypothetical protein AB4Z29_08025 [Paenibacillus sp. 2TAB23]
MMAASIELNRPEMFVYIEAAVVLIVPLLISMIYKRLRQMKDDQLK